MTKRNKPEQLKTPLTYRNGEIRDAEGRQIMVLLPSSCSKKLRDRVGRTVVSILNAEASGASHAQSNGEGARV